MKNFSSESSKLRFLNRDNDDSGVVQNTLQDPAKLRCNKTERNNTEISDTDPISSDENDWMSEREQLEEYFSQALEVDLLLRLCPDDEDTIYQIVDLLVDTCATNRKLLHIAGDDKPAEVVRIRFMKLNADHIRFVLKCLAENSSPIRNMKQYLLFSARHFSTKRIWSAFSFINRLRTTSAGLSSPAMCSSLRLVAQVSTSKFTI